MASGVNRGAFRADYGEVMKVFEEDKLEDLIDGFASEMHRRLLEKMDEGFSGWDEIAPDSYIPRLKASIGKKKWVDVANFAAFIWWHEQKRGADNG